MSKVRSSVSRKAVAFAAVLVLALGLVPLAAFASESQSQGAGSSFIQNVVDQAIRNLSTVAPMAYPDDLADANKPTAKTGLVYTGKALPLVNEPTVPDGGYAVRYALGESTEFSADVPEATNAGTYTVRVEYSKGEGSGAQKYEGDPITVRIDKADSSITNAPTAAASLTYSGSAQALVSGGTVTGGTLMYAVVSGDVAEAPADNAYGEAAQATNAGSYKVWYKVVGDANHNDIAANADKSITATIAQKSISGATVTLSDTSFTHDGSAKTVTVSSVTLGEKPLDATNDYSVSGNLSGTDVGDYTVTVTGEGNYTGTATAMWKIVAAGDATKTVAASADSVTATYDGQPHGITVTATDPTTATVTYGTEEGAYDQTTSPTLTNAGTLTVFWKATATGYEDATGSATITINKADAPAESTLTDAQKPTAKTGLKANGSAQALVTAPSALPAWCKGVRYSIDAGTTWSESIPTGTAAGDYSVQVEYVGNDNYNNLILGTPIVVTIAAADSSDSGSGSDSESGDNSGTNNGGSGDNGSGTTTENKAPTTAVYTDSDAPTVTPTNLDKVAASVLTSSEQTTLNGGTPVGVWLESTPLTNSSLPADDKAAITAAARQMGVTIGQWFDLSMYKQVEGKSVASIHETSVPLEFTLTIPENLRASGRTFYLLRYHDGEVEVIAEGTGDEISGSSDRFSTHALAYKDSGKTAGSSSSTTGKSGSTAAKTGDNTMIVVIVLVVAAVGAGALLLASLLRKKSSSEPSDEE